jgi:predicted phage terminase large subunit-like protein
MSKAGIRLLKIKLAKKSFWEFCRTLAPDFYIPGRTHLERLCETLQALYEGRIIRFYEEADWQIVPSLRTIDPKTYETCYKFILNMPPQHGKSRTLVLFNQWVYGQNRAERILCASYNDTAASDFSRYTRDGISNDFKETPFDIIYNDIFENVRIKEGNASFEKWALSGEFFSYLGCGIQGSVTGKGGTIRIIDDPIKDAAVAFNENELEKIWTWIWGTWWSRATGMPMDIINHTRWSSKDPCGRILASPKAKDWYVLKMEAYDEKTGKVLCEDLLPLSRYMELKEIAESEGGVIYAVFRANYHQEPVDLQGQLYQNLKMYDRIPMDDEGNILFEKIISYTDTADEGADWLACWVAGVYAKELYILDLYYTQDAMETTERETAKTLVQNKVTRAKIESNNGGRGFARNVERIAKEEFNVSLPIEWFHQSENKMARIITQSSFICNHVYFPRGWINKWPEAYKHLTEFQKEKKNKNDDLEDALTGLAEMVNSFNGFEGILDYYKEMAQAKKEKTAKGFFPM